MRTSRAALARVAAGALLALACTNAPAVAGPNGAAGPNAIAHAAMDVGGTAIAPAAAPAAVKRIIAAGNRIARKPYVWGGGHGSWKAAGYDCSGSVSFVLHAAGLLRQPLTSGDFAGWGAPGHGRWVTIYANGTHVWMTIAGLRFDTSGAHPSRWQTQRGSRDGYSVRHIPGL